MWKSSFLCLVALAGAVVSAPYTPSGGAGVAASPPPVYAPDSDFDFQSLVSPPYPLTPPALLTRA